MNIGNWSVFGDEIALQAWVRWESFPSDDPRVISKSDGSEQDHVFMLREDNRRVRERIKTSTSDSCGTNTDWKILE